MGKILVTGGAGLIGSFAVRQLVDAGHDVVVADLFPDAAALGEAASRVTLFRGDIAEPGFFGRTIKEHGIERVLHLAAVLSAEASSDPVKAMRVNILASGELLEQAWIQGVERVCISSSMAVYGPLDIYGDKPVTEQDPPSPTAPYGLSKLAIEIMIKEFRELHAVDAVALRPAVTFGPGRFTALAGAFNKLLRDVALGIPTAFPDWPGGVARGRVQGIFAEDMARAFVRATVGPPTPSYIFNSPTTAAHSIPEVVEMLRHLVPEARIELADREYTALDPFPVMDGTRAIAELGTVPRYSLSEAMAWMIDHYRQGGA